MNYKQKQIHFFYQHKIKYIQLHLKSQNVEDKTV